MYLILVLNIREKEDEGEVHPRTCHKGAGGVGKEVLLYYFFHLYAKCG
jgi:hypothetical protein